MPVVECFLMIVVWLLASGLRFLIGLLLTALQLRNLPKCCFHPLSAYLFFGFQQVLLLDVDVRGGFHYFFAHRRLLLLLPLVKVIGSPWSLLILSLSSLKRWGHQLRLVLILGLVLD